MVGRENYEMAWFLERTFFACTCIWRLVDLDQSREGSRGLTGVYSRQSLFLFLFSTADVSHVGGKDVVAKN